MKVKKEDLSKIYQRLATEMVAAVEEMQREDKIFFSFKNMKKKWNGKLKKRNRNL